MSGYRPDGRVCASSVCAFAGEWQPIGRFGVRDGPEGLDGFARRCLVCERRREWRLGRSGSYDATPGRVRGAREYRDVAGVREMRCTRCGVWQPATGSFFVRDRAHPSGLQVCCLLCRRLAERDRRVRSGEPDAEVLNRDRGRSHGVGINYGAAI